MDVETVKNMYEIDDYGYEYYEESGGQREGDPKNSIQIHWRFGWEAHHFEQEWNIKWQAWFNINFR